MKYLLNMSLKLLKVGWAPLLAFFTHLFLSRVLNVYVIWPSADVPMHFIGGVTIGFFISQCFRFLPRESIRRSRVVILELLLIGSLTVSAAVFWEFAEFGYDRIFGTNIQISLANTVQDMALGTLGAFVVMLVRCKQLRVGFSEVREIAYDWIRA